MYYFTEDLILGNEAIDNDHRRLFELLKRANDLLMNEYLFDRYTQIKEILCELENYADEHFEREEAYMKSINDPEFIIQKQQHITFDENIQEFMVHNLDEDHQQEKVLRELTEYIARWLICHIIGSDSMIGKLPPLEDWMMKDNPCEFSSEYELGIEYLDEEHRELFRIIGEVANLVRDGLFEDSMDEIEKLLSDLRDYTKHHFSDEEEYMESIHYDKLEIQKRAHAAFVYELDSIDLHKIMDNPKKHMQEILEFLLGWLINHILNQDMKIPKK